MNPFFLLLSPIFILMATCLACWIGVYLADQVARFLGCEQTPPGRRPAAQRVRPTPVTPGIVDLVYSEGEWRGLRLEPRPQDVTLESLRALLDFPIDSGPVRFDSEGKFRIRPGRI